ncbi:hypothetical protein PInf_021704 [Phytophthora infestans]|nr:hypothetical protein PInf_021704 [Phytophthora infestans]
MAQFHLHTPSEHTLSGKPLNGEVHFVHTNADGSALMVVDVFLDVINSDSYSKEVSANANRLYNYPGSLATPGCDEIVDWWVVQKPISVSPKDFKHLQAQLKELKVADKGNNACPVLPLNRRKVTK